MSPRSRGCSPTSPPPVSSPVRVVGSRRRSRGAFVLAPSLLLALALLPGRAQAASIVVSAGGPYTVTAGSSVTMTASVTATSTCTGRQYRWDFDGDGTYDTAWSTSTSTTFTASGSTYDGPDSFTTVVQVTSAACGITSTGTGSLTVNNASPTISSTTITSPVDEGVSQTMTVAYADAEALDTHTVSWTFGDGTTGSGSSVTKSFADNGTYTVTVTVTDDDGGTASSTTSVVVSNTAPAVGTQTGTASAAEGSTVSRTCTATDVSADTITWGWNWGDGTTSTSTSGTTSTGTHSYADEGTGSYTVTCTASDEDGGSSSTTGTVAISNAAPVASIGGSTTGTEGVAVTYACSAIDPGTADTVSYAWTFSDGGSGSGATVLHTWADNGTYTATCTATDNDGASGTGSTTTFVNNVAPTITSASASAASTTEGSTLSFLCLGTDVSSDTLSYLWTFGDGTSSATSGPTHAYTDEGTYTATCTVTDDDGGTSNATTRVTVTNLSPSINSYTIPTSGTEGSALSFSASATDPGSDTLTYTWNFGDGSTATGASASHTYTDNGTYSVTLTVSDGDGGSDSRTQSVVVANASPVIASLEGDETLNEGDSGSYVVRYSDAGADTLTISWDFGDGTTDADIDGTDHTYEDNGDYVITVTICDDDGACAVDTLDVHVDNVDPVVTSLTGDTSGYEGDTLSFACGATDAGAGDPITYTLDYGDGDFDSGSSGTHVFRDEGTYTVTCMAEDESGGVGTETMTVTIANVAPTLTSASTSAAGDEGTALAFSASATDPGDDTLTYTWDFGDGTLATGASVTHAYADEGTYTVTVTVSDGDGGVVSTSGTASVANAAPVISLTSPGSGDEGADLPFGGGVVDPGSADTVTCTWDWGDGSTDAWTGDTTHAYADEGSYTVTLTCADDDGATSSATASVTIANAPPTITSLDVDTSGNEGEALDFVVVATDCGSGDTWTVTWDYGDGTTGLGDNTTHTYASDGTYTVTVTLTDNDGGTTTETIEVVVANVAPTIASVAADTVGTEGQTLAYAASASDPGTADVLTYTWDWGDGTTSTGDSVTHAWGDNGSWTVLLTVDDGEASVTSTFTVDTTNVAPTIEGTPSTTAYVGGAYTFAPVASDPGTLDTFVWTGSLPAGATLDAATGALRWTPTTADIGFASLSLVLTDDDGESGTLEWTVEVTFHDRDGDGLPDEWEEDHGLDPDDPSDAHDDPDGDGRDNTQEYTDGTPPEIYDGPSAPVALSPEDGSEVALLSDITLVIQNADSPLDLPLTYTFDLYDDDDNAVESSDALDGDPSGETSYTLHSELTENTWYWWEAAADDGWVVGPSTGPQTFFYNTVNEAPGAPGINNPFQGSSVSSIRPTLVLDEATDPDEDILTYSYVLTDTIGNEIETTEGVAGNGLTASWTVSTALTDGATYCWYGWATDPDGLTGPDSDSACFTVDTHNQGPSAPVIISPPDGSSINTETVDIVLTDGVDPEGRGLQHVFQIDTEETFTSEDFQTGTVLSDGSGQTTWTTAPLVDDTWYHVRALASDGAAYSEWATSTFRVKIGNHAPETPELYSPEDEATVASGTPLVVTNAVDADDDPITYYFVVYDMDGNEVQDGDTPEDLSGTTAWTPSQLPYGTYTWTARAVDVYGFSSDWADPWTFTVGEIDTGECTGKFCEDGTLMGGGCGCTTPGTATAGVAWLAVAGALALSRRQR